MTVVEFFDRVSIDNMVSCFTIKPDKIIFIGDVKQMKKQAISYYRFTKKRGLNIEFDFRSINRNNVEQIISVLTSIVEEEKDCVFDLTGGEDLVLVAMGIVFERCKEKHNVKLHRFNVRTGSVLDCDNDGVIPYNGSPQLSVEENIILYGGSIVPYNGEGGTYIWDFNDDFVSDVEVLWEICRENPGLWNSLIGVLTATIETVEDQNDDLFVLIDKQHALEITESRKQKYTEFEKFLNWLDRYGFIIISTKDANEILFRFKNKQIQMCLTKAGTLLELMVILLARNAKDKNGESQFNDSVTGVVIDWDAILHDGVGEYDTENEIDVILMKGLVPAFVSCKNGFIDETELYKLNTVAERFGGPYAKKVLVATYLGKTSDSYREGIKKRADDMNINVIDNVHKMSIEEFSKSIRNIFC